MGRKSLRGSFKTVPQTSSTHNLVLSNAIKHLKNNKDHIKITKEDKKKTESIISEEEIRWGKGKTVSARILFLIQIVNFL